MIGRITNFSIGYKGKIAFVVIGTIVGVASLFFTNYIARELSAKEKNEIMLWAEAWNMKNQIDHQSQIESQMILNVINYTTTIPAIVTDEYLNVVYTQAVDPRKINTPEKFKDELKRMASGHNPIEIYNGRNNITVFYDDSPLLQLIYIFPYIQLMVILLFISFGSMTFSSSKDNEQNKIWIGMAKETAHQLGTPISSLLGWVEYIRSSQEGDDIITNEMSKDIQRLITVADRFSKIGSSVQMSASSVYESVSRTVDYFRTRVPKNVTIGLESNCGENCIAMLNSSLFEWVMENLLKNALDALGGVGAIRVNMICDQNTITVDVTDTGKGISKSNYNDIFKPGYTTKTRGWGLGLSLSRRIVEEYHYGKIFVKESELGKGTTIRIVLNKYMG